MRQSRILVSRPAIATMPLALMAAALRQPLDQWPANRGGRWYLCQRCLDTLHMRLEIRRRDAQRWRAPELRRHLLTIVDADGSARRDTSSPGLDTTPPLQDASVLPTMPAPNSSTILMESLIERASAGDRLHESEIVQLFSARGGNVDQSAHTANALQASPRALPHSLMHGLGRRLEG